MWPFLLTYSKHTSFDVFLEFRLVLEALEGIPEVFSGGVYTGGIPEAQPIFRMTSVVHRTFQLECCIFSEDTG